MFGFKVEEVVKELINENQNKVSQMMTINEKQYTVTIEVQEAQVVKLEEKE